MKYINAIEISGDEMAEIFYGDLGEVLEDKIVDTGRWSIRHSIVFKLDDLLYQAYCSRPATEYQDEPWDEIYTCFRVEPKERLITVYERI